MGGFTPPPTRYARSGEVNIAYQELGWGPVDLVYVPGFVSNLELAWQWPALAAFQRALASFSRAIFFDKRGTGLSDRAYPVPTLAERRDDLRAVMDAARSDSAVLVGVSEGAALAITYAVAHPERVRALILYAPLPCAVRRADYPWAEDRGWWEDVARRFADSWGDLEYMQEDVAWRAPSEAGNAAFVHWWGAYRRLGASPGAAAELARLNSQVDVRALLPRVVQPTTVIVRIADRVVRRENAQYVSKHIPEATLVELSGDDHLPFVGDADAVVNAIARAAGEPRRIAVGRDDYAGAPAPSYVAAHAWGLTDREFEVIRHVAAGRSNSEAADVLHVTSATVRKHLENAYRKLGVRSRTAAVAKLNGSLRKPD